MVLIWILWAGGASAAGLSDVPVSEYIRLHVVAADDGAEAQALKLEVRDATLEVARALLKDCGDADAAWDIIGENVDALEAAAMARARALGYEGRVRAETGVFDFPDRHYGAVFVPAGRYRALRVVIGEGAGHNWWCVLYPSLCVPEGKVPTLRSALLDWLRRLAGGGR
jgi:stage II sporulation protein R